MTKKTKHDPKPKNKLILGSYHLQAWKYSFHKDLDVSSDSKDEIYELARMLARQGWHYVSVERIHTEKAIFADKR